MEKYSGRSRSDITDEDIEAKFDRTIAELDRIKSYEVQAKKAWKSGQLKRDNVIQGFEDTADDIEGVAKEVRWGHGKV